MVDVLTYYDQHPINEKAIVDALLREDKNLGKLKPSDLFLHDQDHYGGLVAVESLSKAANIGASDRVLDVCSGMGGPARYIADAYGCQVMGLELNRSRVVSAARLTARVALADKVGFVCGDATRMPFENGTFTRVVSQEAFLHIEDKTALFANCARVLELGGCLTFTDWVASSRLTESERAVLGEGMAAVAIHGEDEYVAYLEAGVLSDIAVEDLSVWWMKLLRQRLQMYQEKREGTERLFGVRSYRDFIDAYEIFVRVVEEGKLGGARFSAVHLEGS